jgi:hypothetical protein
LKGVIYVKRTNRQIWPLIVVLSIFISPLLMVELSHAWNNSTEVNLSQTQPLTIDYSTYLGGTGGDEHGITILIDSENNPIVIGNTNSVDFPATIGTPTPYTDVFVAKFNADNLSEPIFITVFGGNNWDSSSDAVIDDENNVYIGGSTTSTSGFATPGVVDSTYNGYGDAFVSKIAANGSLVYSTYLGGSDYDAFNLMMLDSSNDLWVAGQTRSDNFPRTADAFDKVYKCNESPPDPLYARGEIFYTKISNNGSKILYSSYLGGESREGLWGMTIDDSDNLILAGRTFSNDFPITENAWDKHLSGDEDMYLTKFSSNGSGLLYSTFIGGTGMEEPFHCIVDPEGNYILSGITDSSDFPVSSNAYDDTLTGNSDSFILKLLADGSSLIFSTYLGGSSDTPIVDSFYGSSGDEIAVIECDETTSDIYFAGYTDSIDWPTTDGTTYNGGGGDIILGILSADGSSLKYSSLIGGSGTDRVIHNGYIRLNSNEAYLAPRTSSSDFNVTSDAFQISYSGGNDAAFMKVTYPELEDTTTTTTTNYTSTTTTTTTTPSNGGTSGFELVFFLPLLAVVAVYTRIFRKKQKK